MTDWLRENWQWVVTWMIGGYVSMQLIAIRVELEDRSQKTRGDIEQLRARINELA